MRLYEEVVKKINLSGGGDLFGCARCTLIFGGGGYFEGVRGIIDLSETKIVLALKSGVLEIIGERLGVEKYLEGDVELSGKILTVALTDATQKTTQQTQQTQQITTQTATKRTAKPTAQTAPKTANTTVKNGGDAQ